MSNRAFIKGFVVLCAGLFASSVSSFLELFTVFGAGTDFVRGVFDGLSAVAFAVAIVMLVRSRAVPPE